MISCVFLQTILFLGLGACCEDPSSNTRFYVILMCHQNAEKIRAIPSKAHSFAVFIKVLDDELIDEYFTISWSSTDGVKLFAAPQRGINHSFEETVDRALHKGLCVKRWGPYEMTSYHYERAKYRFAFLEKAEINGQAKWNCLDKNTRFRACVPAFNCIHAVADITDCILRTGVHCGEKATCMIVNHFKDTNVIINRHQTHEWVWLAIASEQYQKCVVTMNH